MTDKVNQRECSMTNQRSLILSTTPSPSAIVEDPVITCIFCSSVISYANSRYRICNSCSTELFNDSHIIEESKVSSRAVTPLAYLSDDEVMSMSGDDDPPSLPKFSSTSLNVDHAGCVSCMSNSINTVFIPCGHAAMCSQCVQSSLAINPQEKRCPICRQMISSVTPLYLSGVKMSS